MVKTTLLKYLLHRKYLVLLLVPIGIVKTESTSITDVIAQNTLFPPKKLFITKNKWKSNSSYLKEKQLFCLKSSKKVNYQITILSVIFPPKAKINKKQIKLSDRKLRFNQLAI